MIIKICDAAKTLNRHPLDLLLQLYPLVGSFEDCWPEVDQGHVDTLRAMESKHEFRREDAEQIPKTTTSASDQGSVVASSVSPHAARVVEKLWRQDRWGKNAISWDTMRNHYCRGIDHLEQAVEELLKKEYLLAETKRGPYSLNPAHKGEIDAIARKSAAQS